jgi:predicted translin family RNA/ssDNA-binding protein
MRNTTRTKHQFTPAMGPVLEVCAECGQGESYRDHYTKAEREIQRQVGELVGEMIRDADKRNRAFVGGVDEAVNALHAHTDAMRDLREALADLGLLS